MNKDGAKSSLWSRMGRKESGKRKERVEEGNKAEERRGLREGGWCF